MKTGEPVESLSLITKIVLLLRKYNIPYGKTGCEIYIHIKYCMFWDDMAVIDRIILKGRCVVLLQKTAIRTAPC